MDMRAGTYYLAKRIKGGVRASMIREAARLLDLPYSRMLDHVAMRIKTNYQIPGDPWKWLSERPYTTKAQLADRMRRQARLRWLRRVEIKRTTGTSGTPFMAVKDVEMAARIDATMWAVYGWHGVRPGQRHARFWGMPPRRIQRWRRRLEDAVCNRSRFDAFQVDDRNVLNFFHGLRRSRPRYLHGYPTLLDAFAARCTNMGLDGTDIALHVVFSTGEFLLPEVKQRIGRFFGCPVINEYGCSEAGLLGFECESGTLHQLPLAAWLEVAGDLVDPGGEDGAGEVVVTDLYGRIEPLVRYRNGDRARVDRGPFPCSCGRELPQLTVEHGRMGALIRTPTGREVFSAIVAYSMPPGVRRYRTYQHSVRAIEVLLELEDGVDARTAVDSVVGGIRMRLPDEMIVNCHVVDHIEITTGGKFRDFVPLRAAGSG